MTRSVPATNMLGATPEEGMAELNIMADVCLTPIEKSELTALMLALSDSEYWGLITVLPSYKSARVLEGLAASLAHRLPSAPWHTTDTPTTQACRIHAAVLATIDEEAPTPLWTIVGLPPVIHADVPTDLLKNSYIDIGGRMDTADTHHAAPLETALTERGAMADALNLMCTCRHGPKSAIGHHLRTATTHTPKVTPETWGYLSARLCILAPHEHGLLDAWTAAVATTHNPSGAYEKGLVYMMNSVPTAAWHGPPNDGFMAGFLHWIRTAPLDAVKMTELATAGAMHTARRQYAPLLAALARPDVLGLMPILTGVLGASHISSDRVNHAVVPLLPQCSPEQIMELEGLVWNDWGWRSLSKTVRIQTKAPAGRSALPCHTPILSALFDLLPDHLKLKWTNHHELTHHIPAIQAALLNTVIADKVRPDRHALM